MKQSQFPIIFKNRKLKDSKICDLPINNSCVRNRALFFRSLLSDIFPFVSYLQNSYGVQFIIFNLVFPMFKKTELPRLSSKNLRPLPLQFAEVDDIALDEVIKTIQTPRHQSYKIKDLQATQTQKLSMAKRATTIREKLPSLSKNLDPCKENLLDLDLCFLMDSSRLCQNERMTERNHFVVRRVNTPSKSSKGKDTSAGSSDSSLEGTQNVFGNIKNATDSPQIKMSDGRGKSYTKNMQPCRIVNSKKLPFNLNQRGIQKRKSNLEEMDLDISIIERKQSQQRLISLEIYHNLCALL